MHASLSLHRLDFCGMETWSAWTSKELLYAPTRSHVGATWSPRPVACHKVHLPIDSFSWLQCPTRAFKVSFQLLTLPFLPHSCRWSALLPCQNQQLPLRHGLFSFSNQEACRKLASSLGFNIVVPKFNYYLSLNSIFLKRDFPFYFASGYKPLILYKKYDLL